MLAPKQRIDSERCIGTSAGSIYCAVILAHDRARRARVRHYRSAPSLQRRLPNTASAQALVSAALERRTQSSAPFWQALMGTIRDRGVVPGDLLDAALFHQDLGPGHEVARRQLERGELERLATASSAPVALDSRLELVDGCAHLPFMDFRIPASGSNTQLVSAVCRRLLPEGFVALASGRSYHACGVALHDAEERVAFLGRALLFSPIVDDRYIAHQLMHESSALRISGSSGSDPAPEVVAIWYPEQGAALLEG